MSRLSACFKDWAERGHSAVVPYIVAGDPEPGLTVGLMHELVQQGADIIELGVPFSDPIAEGPVIQKAHERALEHNVSLRNVLSMVTEFRQKDTKTPVVLMGYANPVEHMGYEQFAEAASAAGVDGLFMETHFDPSNAKSDGANMLDLSLLEKLLTDLTAIRKTINSL